MIKRSAAGLAGLALLGLVVWLYFLSTKDPHYVAVFGLASALAAPLGISALGYSLFRSKVDVMNDLAKVPEIGRLIEQARSQEERVRLLEAEQARLAEIIRLESRRQAVKDRITTLEEDAIRITHELEALDAELLDLGDQIGQSPASEEIQRLRERIQGRERGDLYVTLGSRVIRIDRDIVKALPLGMGNVALGYFKLAQLFTEWWKVKLREVN